MSLHVPTMMPGDSLPPGALSAASTYDGVERRGTVRVELPFPATVRGVDATGERFEDEVLVDSLSIQGVYLRLCRPITPGTRLFICVKLWLDEGIGAPGPRAATYGRLLLSESQRDDRCGIAVVFDRHRFLYAGQA